MGDVFRKEGIDGECLRVMTKADLRDFGLNFKDAQRVMAALEALRRRGGEGEGEGGGMGAEPPRQVQTADAGHGMDVEGMHEKAQEILNSKFGEGMIQLPVPNSRGATQPTQREVEMMPVKKSFTQLRAEMYEEPPPRPPSMDPEISEDVKGALLSEGIFPTDVESMPPEIRSILSRRPDLLKQAMDRSKENAMRKEMAGGDIFSDDLLTIQEEAPTPPPPTAPGLR